MKKIITDIVDFLNINSNTGNTLEALQWIKKKCNELDIEIFFEQNGNILAKKQNLAASGLVLSGHYDTVKGDIKVELTDDFIYGRGSSDMKSGVLSMLYAVSKATILSPVIALTCDEETDSSGANLLKEMVKDYKYCIVCEPTSLKLCTAHRGRTVYKLVLKGERVHASVSPMNNVFYELSKVLSFLKTFPNKKNDFLGLETITPVSVKSYPDIYNVTPDKLELFIDRRKTTSINNFEEDLEIIRNMFDKINLKNYYIEIDPNRKFNTLSYFCKDKNFINIAKKSMKNLKLDCNEYPFTATCDGSFFGEKLPVLILGPGDLSEAHTKNEKVNIEQILKSVELYLNINKGVFNGL
ncbi:MAG: M20/M25/M40 family metallo-hydrolase [Candidatus Muirbacterium halophilum]|nr:M20/M25/M40 family metallo-hydrolase [Candidatus Muirbacterium halophilum]MCK9474469.1 M20/M25/M40 family metallo-hydrolase [Candidatus Muirbacterium halophilum]